MSSTMGRLFRVTTFGESHGAGIGAIVDGCPSALEVQESAIQAQLDRRRPGQSSLTTARSEPDKVKILSGLENGLTLGSPICLLIENKDARPRDYEAVSKVPRPSHADYTYRMKYGIQASSGGGRSSARETAARVAAGSIAEQYLADRLGIEIVAWVSAAGRTEAQDLTGEPISRKEVDATPVRCPDHEAADRMVDAIHKAKDAGDSLGGVVTCVCRGLPVGLGEPVFGKIEAALAGAMLSIPATKGFEIGSGFEGSRMRGSEHNDAFVVKPSAAGDRLGTETNRSGGVQGGLTNGEPVVFRVAFKPTATIRVAQKTVDYEGKPVVLKPEKGRHDPCVLPRAVPVVEAMAALVLADMARLAGN